MTQTDGAQDKTRDRLKADSATPRLRLFSGRRLSGSLDIFRASRPGFDALTTLQHRKGSAEALREEQGLLWAAFAFAAGIALYGMLPGEPDWRVLLALSAVGGAFMIKSGSFGHLPAAALVGVCLWAGVVVSSARTAFVAAPRIAEEMSVTLRGQVLSVQPQDSGPRIVLGVATVNGRPAGPIGFPERVRVRLPGTADILPGQRIETRARLFPPPGPVVPGGYDFSFRAFFEGIGATGFAYGAPELVSGPAPGLLLQATKAVADMRARLGGRIRAALGDGPETALAIALLVGDRSGIDERQEDSLRAAGLAHILAISGLHMALFAGGAYSVCLALLALIPGLPVRWPIHKIAACIALAAASFYLVLSGASVATQRSFIMISLVFLGVLSGRRGLTLRSVALAAVVLLVLAPERVFSPGFQMSFAAVVALVAVYGAWRRSRKDSKWPAAQHGTGARIAARLLGWVAGLFVTALVAGLATGIVAAHHFARIAPYGLVGNMLAMPVFSLIVMPMGVLSLALMPFGLAVYPLKVMSLGLAYVLEIADHTAQLAPGVGLVGQLPASAAICLLAGLYLGLLAPGWWRVSSAAALMAGITLAALARPPDIQIAAMGERLAARDQSGLLRLSSGRSTFAAVTWLQAEGVSEDSVSRRKMTDEQRRCDEKGCVVKAHVGAADRGASRGAGRGAGGERFGSPVVIAFSRTVEALRRDCQHADIIVSDLIAPPTCSAPYVVGGQLRRSRGAVSIWLTAQGGELHNGTNSSFSDEPGASSRRKANAGGRANNTVVAVRRVRFAVPDPPRPWHRPGTFYRARLWQDR